MFSHLFLLLLSGTLCSTKSIISKSILENEKKKFALQAGDETEDPNDPTFVYLHHSYYDINYSQLTDFKDITLDPETNSSAMTYQDDPPPFEQIRVDEHGWIIRFYGHAHQLIFIDSNGFASMVPLYCPHFGFCNWQEPEGHVDSQYQRYIAPMMTDFNPKRFEKSKVSYRFDTTDGMHSFTVQWTKVVLFSYNNPLMNPENDGFTFQLVIYENGDIIFNYKTIPYFPGNKTLKEHPHSQPKRYPLIGGIEDAVIVQRDGKPVLADYNPLHVDWETVMDLYEKSNKTGVQIKFTALPTCPEFKSCHACVNYTTQNREIPGRLLCGWCEQVQICADTTGRESSSLSTGCLATNGVIKTFKGCDNIGKVEKNEKNSTVLIIVIVMVVILVVVVIALSVYSSRMRGELAKYSKGIPEDAESAEKSNKTPGLKHVQPAPNKEEMSA